MQIRQYHGDTLAEALQKAKREWGDEVILLESQQMSGEATGFLVTIGVDDQTIRMKPWRPPNVSKKRTKPKEPAQKKGAFGQTLENAFTRQNIRSLDNRIADELATLRNEIKNLNQRTAALVENSDVSKADEGKAKRKIETVLNKVIGNLSNRHRKEKQILDEIATLREQVNLLGQKAPAQESKVLQDAFVRTFSLLVDSGFHKDFAKRLIKLAQMRIDRASEIMDVDVQTEIKKELSSQFHPFKFQPKTVAGKQQMVLLLGPTGSGKSSSALRLASDRKFYGRYKTGVISITKYGLSEELRAWTALTGHSVVEARDIQELQAAISKFKDKDVIIFDAPGQSPFAPNHLKDLEGYLRVIEPTEILLVLSVTADLRDMYLACGLYLLLNPTGLLFTKFDETTQPGKVFSILDEINLPLVSFTETDKIFFDAFAPDIDYLFRKIFDMNEGG